jgi:hypothetical protein
MVVSAQDSLFALDSPMHVHVPASLGGIVVPTEEERQEEIVWWLVAAEWWRMFDGLRDFFRLARVIERDARPRLAWSSLSPSVKLILAVGGLLF